MPPSAPNRFDPKLKGSSTPGLPPHRSEAISNLTAKARLLTIEEAENASQIDVLHLRQGAIRAELAAIRKQVIEHAWDGQPPC